MGGRFPQRLSISTSESDYSERSQSPNFGLRRAMSLHRCALQHVGSSSIGKKRTFAATSEASDEVSAAATAKSAVLIAKSAVAVKLHVKRATTITPAASSEVDLDRDVSAIASMTLKTTPQRDLKNKKNIDAAVLGTPAFASIYSILLYDSFNARELLLKVSCYMTRPLCTFGVKTRAQVVETVQFLCWRAGLLQSTLHLAVSILERFLVVWTLAPSGKQPIDASQLLRLALASILLSFKLEENLPGAAQGPFTMKLLMMSKASNCSKKELVQCERVIAFALNFDLIAPTAHSFLLRYVRAGELNETQTLISGCLIDRCLLEYDIMTQYEPSCVAAAAVSLARQVSGNYSWTGSLAHYTAYSENDIGECKTTIQRALRKEEIELASGLVSPSATPHHTTSVAKTLYYTKTIREWYSPQVYGYLMKSD